MSKEILIISDDKATGASLCQTLNAGDFTTRLTDDADKAFALLRESQFDLAIINLKDAVNSINLIRRVRADEKLSRMLLLSIAEWGTGQGTMALVQGADSFEPAPVQPAQLAAAVKRLLRPNLVMTAKATNGDSGELGLLN
jgi:DNA-binding response OmpR family regulator